MSNVDDPCVHRGQVLRQGYSSSTLKVFGLKLFLMFILILFDHIGEGEKDTGWNVL